MLGKLIKHEFKAVNRLLLPLHLGLIAVTVIGRFYLQFTVFGNAARAVAMSQNIWYNIINVLLTSFYVIALIAVAMITWIYLHILRFRNNLFTDEGYLMHTLPVPASAHIWSKLLVCLIWEFIDVLLILLSVCFLFVNQELLRVLPEGLSLLIEAFPEAFGVSAGTGFALYLLLFLFDGLSGILIIYMCIAVGHSFHTHRILSSVGIYTGVTVLNSIIGTIFSAITGLVSFSAFPALNGAYTTYSATANFWLSWIFGMLLTVINGVVCYLLTEYFMKKKLNLE